MADFELQLVAWLQQRQKSSQTVAVGIGDDMAVIRLHAGRRILTASDMLLDGVHFDSRIHDLALVGRKAIACNLSDCAAMAARPLAATVSVALPRGLTLNQARRLFEGIEAIADEFDLAIAGGDTTRWDHPLAVDVAIVAEPYDGIEPVTRSNAREGDALYVTGQLGGSLLGRHLTFTPRVREAKLLAEGLGPRLHAMMDLSDGLSLDLFRMCEASGVGAILDESLLAQVVSPAAREASAADHRSPQEHALGDGEDFELLLAAEPDVVLPAVPLLRVGEVTRKGLTIRDPDGTLRILEPRGYVH
ncbi:MAG: thiamine-phosphate kinase [Phycisphaerales bacterium]|nr:thiamine-phosphate kinase [Phycisphaerales bacterium]